jgi:hypothetical protein
MRRRWNGLRLPGQRVVRSTSLLLGVALAGLLTTVSWAGKHEKTDGPTPSIRIATAPLDYHPLSSFYLMSRTSSSSLDFIDDQHMLFTFRATGLMKRLPECQPGDEDQLIRALVVHVPDGKIERTAEWRMHDRGRYLWSRGNGKFLVRRQDEILLTDASLELQPFITSTTPLRLIKLSPDAKLVLVETDLEKHTPEEHQRLAEASLAEDLPPPREDVQMTILRVDDRSVVLRMRTLSVTDLPIISNGYLETLSAQGDHWMIRYRPFSGEPSVIGDVASSCRPSESPLNAETTVVTLCSERGDDHVSEAISLSGKVLWSYRWDNHYIWPTSASSESGTRIAFSTLRVAHAVNSREPIDETDLQQQRVEVLDVDTGRLELTQYASPVLSAGQNYALSADGGRFAVLRDNAIEIYDLPPAARESGMVSKVEGNAPR